MAEVRSRPWPGQHGKSREHEVIVDHWPPLVTVLGPGPADPDKTEHFASWGERRHVNLAEVERMIEALAAARDVMRGSRG